MSPIDALAVIGSVVLGLGGLSAVVIGLSKWLGGVWASRILENEKAATAREYELLVRRRDVYRRLAGSMRVFLKGSQPSSEVQKTEFLQAYDEGALWASDEVIERIAAFLDLMVLFTANQSSVPQPALNAALVACIDAMRRDCGFPNTKYRHRVVSFEP